ncbi:zinc finger protein 628-like [Trachemys scripta elegans]|uniref:zinc finger protein 628-like n=1 Tax=Trachemys scripta elegans TaxID=31138 RepID=UPI001553E0FE|nr:zinc finger protein 628-like [Trachemys scripta elegans]
MQALPQPPELGSMQLQTLAPPPPTGGEEQPLPCSSALPGTVGSGPEVSGMQESQDLLVVQSGPGEELLGSGGEVGVHLETLQTEEGVQSVLVLRGADGEQTRLCVQEVENLQELPADSGVGGLAPSSGQKLFIIRSAPGEQTLQVLENVGSGSGMVRGVAPGGQPSTTSTQMVQLLPSPVPPPQELSSIQIVQTVPSVQLVHTF